MKKLNLLGIALLLLFPFSHVAYATDNENFSFTPRAEFAAGFFHSQEDYAPANRSSVNWLEGYLELGLDIKIKLSGGSYLYGGISGLASMTGIDGDAGGFTSGDEADIDFEDGFGGIHWASPGGFIKSIDISGGRQFFKVGDGFLIHGDSLNAGEQIEIDTGVPNLDRGGAYWLAARKNFTNTGIVKVETNSPFQFDAFYLQADNAIQGDPKIVGADFRWIDENYGTFGLMALNVIEADNLFFLERDERWTVSGRYSGTPFSDKNLTIAGEFAYQFKDGTIGNPADNDVEAYGFHAGFTYSFSEMRWKPTVSYRFSHFSGDDPSTANTNEGFDPLFFGFSTGYGTWYQGEVAANYSGPFSSNNNVHKIEVTVQPTEQLIVGGIFYNFTADEGNISEGNEINLYAWYFINEKTIFTPLIGWHLPDSDATPFGLFGNTNRDDSFYAQAAIIMNF